MRALEVSPGDLDEVESELIVPIEIADPDLDLAGRLETVLQIAARLVASHDREELFRMILDETMRTLRVDSTTIRILNGDHLEITAWAGMADEVARRLPLFRQDEGWPGEVIRTRRAIAWSDVHAIRGRGFERYAGVYDFVGLLVAPLIHHGRVIGALSAVTHEARAWTRADIAFISTLATHAAIALSNAELLEQTERRAAQLEMLQAASARMSRAGTVEEVGRTVVEETGRIIDYHNARVYLIEPPDRVIPIAFQGAVGAYERVDMAVLHTRIGEGFTGWVAQRGEPLLVNDANSDPRGRTIPGTDDVDESMLVVPMRYDAVTIGRDHPVQAGSQRVRSGGSPAADDPRRPGRDRRRIGTAPQSYPGSRPGAAPSARHECRPVDQPGSPPGC
ncbi:MAG: GAF domain-containing protein [Candidatus Limnocylindrales bacterium]